MAGIYFTGKNYHGFEFNKVLVGYIFILLQVKSKLMGTFLWIKSNFIALIIPRHTVHNYTYFSVTGMLQCLHLELTLASVLL